ncbi:MAG: metallo-beta-lactamase class [Acidobacteriota bacterium]|jgi:metallo-beta-lactamase class B|nr:metallo-beta-lactamase class [Acidobacteriota bacterium]
MRYALALLLLFAGQADPESRSWNQPVTPFRIAENVYYVGASDVTSYLITTPKGHIVIDGGFAETAPMIRRNIEQLGFRISDVRILLSSHAHYDHAGGLAELKSASGATFYASTGDAPQLARGGLDDPQFGNRFPFPPITADRLLHDGSRVTLGGTTLIAHVTPGHTKGCTTWTLKTKEGLDVVFIGSSTVPTGYRIAGNPRYPDAIDDYRKQFAILRSLKCDVFLASHGNFYDLAGKMKRLGDKTNPFIDPDGYRAFVKATSERMEKVAAEQRK